MRFNLEGIFQISKSVPFVKSNLGILEWELCSRLGKFPTEIGEERAKNPDSIRFLELAIIHEYERKEKAYKEAERKSKTRHR